VRARDFVSAQVNAYHRYSGRSRVNSRCRPASEIEKKERKKERKKEGGKEKYLYYNDSVAASMPRDSAAGVLQHAQHVGCTARAIRCNPIAFRHRARRAGRIESDAASGKTLLALRNRESR